MGLDELAADDAAFENGPEEVRVATANQRRRALLVLLETLRSGLAVTADALEPAEVDLRPTLPGRGSASPGRFLRKRTRGLRPL